jgi:hypothetical protein
MATGNALNANSTGLQKYDGAGSWSGVTVTNHGTLVGAASNGITSIVQGAGQLLIGTTASDPTAASLTAGTGVSITSATGAITINAVGGGVTWSTVTVDATFTVNTGTVANKAGLLTMTLPATASLGDIIAITGINTALGWKIAQNANQQIFFGTSSTTAGITGSLASINIRDTIYLVCVVAGASTVYNVESVIGNITVV